MAGFIVADRSHLWEVWNQVFIVFGGIVFKLGDYRIEDLSADKSIQDWQ